MSLISKMTIDYPVSSSMGDDIIMKTEEDFLDHTIGADEDSSDSSNDSSDDDTSTIKGLSDTEVHSLYKVDPSEAPDSDSDSDSDSSSDDGLIYSDEDYINIFTTYKKEEAAIIVNAPSIVVDMADSHNQLIEALDLDKLRVPEPPVHKSVQLPTITEQDAIEDIDPYTLGDTLGESAYYQYDEDVIDPFSAQCAEEQYAKDL